MTVGKRATRPRLVIDVGHSSENQGACAPFPPHICEWEYNNELADWIREAVTETEVHVISRESSTDGYRDVPGRINELTPDFIISLHCNAATESAFGTEMIYWPGSIGGRMLATLLLQSVSRVFGWLEGERGYRGIKGPIEGKGEILLRKTVAPCVICEPFFLTNSEDLSRGLRYKRDLAAAYARAIDTYSVSLGE